MSSLSYSNEPPSEWEVKINCDGVVCAFVVKRRRASYSHSAGDMDVETFQLWSGNVLRGEFVLPASGDIAHYRSVALETLNRVLECDVATIESDRDAVDALFGFHGAA